MDKNKRLKIAYLPQYEHFLPAGHRFPMAKYSLLAQQLIHEGTCESDNFFMPDPPDDKYLLAVHDDEYYYDLLNLTLPHKQALAIGFPLSTTLIYRERAIAGGTISGVEYALQNGLAMNIAGGTHHAYADRGEGFCMLNDQAIGAQYLLDKKLAKQILIIDLDVHQGNGTAKIFENEPKVFTFSMHGEKNYPFTKENSDLDIGLPDGTGDTKYLETLKNVLLQLLDQIQPDFVFYLSGVDILESDTLGRLSCSIEGCRQRDQYVLKKLFERKLPVQISMGGGYSKQLRHIVTTHSNTFRIAQDIYFS